MEGEDQGDLFDEVWKLTGKFYLDRSFGGNNWEKVGVWVYGWMWINWVEGGWSAVGCPHVSNINKQIQVRKDLRARVNPKDPASEAAATKRMLKLLGDKYTRVSM